MMKLIAIDIGNTNITVGIFSGERLIGRSKISTHAYSLYSKNFKKLLKDCCVEGSCAIIISSVVPVALCRLVSTLNKIISSRAHLSVPYHIKIVGKDVKVPIKNLYKVKSEVGQDRLVNAFSAREQYGAPCVVIDFGTAITFDAVSRRGDYLGGLILPGIEISLSSLYEKTALLPKVGLKDARSIIGKDTADSMRGGILFGFGAMCDGLIAKYKKILGSSTKIIATGGNVDIMRRYTGSIKFVDEDLTLKGLQAIAKKI